MADNGIQIEGLVFEAGAGAGRDGGSSPVDARSRAVAPTLTEDDLAPSYVLMNKTHLL